jgi:hypothetical protein
MRRKNHIDLNPPIDARFETYASTATLHPNHRDAMIAEPF